MASAGSLAPAPAFPLVVARDPFERAAEILVEWIESLAEHRGEIRVAIPGGSALEAVARAVPRLGTLWSRVALTWVDERCVPVSDPESNRGAALRRGIPLATAADGSSDPARAHDARELSGSVPARTLALFEDGESPEQAQRRVERRLASELRDGLDVVVLGLGTDGHVASLFPGRAELRGTVACVADSPKPPARRMTLTRTLLLCAQRTLVVAAGAEKKLAVQRLLDGDPRLPATGLPGLVVVCDPACAPEAT